MKRVLLTILLACLLIIPCYAETTSKGDYPLQGNSKHTTAIREHTHQYEDKYEPDTDTVIPDTTIPKNDKNAETFKTIVSVDAPNIVVFTDDITFGMEAGKDMYMTDVSEGWFVNAKVTITTVGFDFRKK